MQNKYIALIGFLLAVVFLIYRRGGKDNIDSQIELQKLRNQALAVEKSIAKKKEDIRKLESIAKVVDSSSNALSNLSGIFKPLFSFGSGSKPAPTLSKEDAKKFVGLPGLFS